MDYHSFINLLTTIYMNELNFDDKIDQKLFDVI